MSDLPRLGRFLESKSFRAISHKYPAYITQLYRHRAISVSQGIENIFVSRRNERNKRGREKKKRHCSSIMSSVGQRGIRDRSQIRGCNKSRRARRGVVVIQRGGMLEPVEGNGFSVKSHGPVHDAGP